MIKPNAYLGTALVAIHQARSDATEKPFTKSELLLWCAKINDKRAAAKLLDDLKRAGLVVRALRNGVQHPIAGIAYYRLTADGALAAKTAAAQNHDTSASTFAARLWALLRIRGALTSAEAGQLLADAGSNIAAAKKKASDWLMAWHKAHPTAVQISQVKINGYRRFVLVNDLGAIPDVKRTGGAKA